MKTLLFFIHKLRREWNSPNYIKVIKGLSRQCVRPKRLSTVQTNITHMRELKWNWPRTRSPSLQTRRLSEMHWSHFVELLICLSFQWIFRNSGRMLSSHAINGQPFEISCSFISPDLDQIYKSLILQLTEWIISVILRVIAALLSYGRLITGASTVIKAAAFHPRSTTMIRTKQTSLQTPDSHVDYQ